MSTGGIPAAGRASLAPPRPPFDKVTIAFHWATVLAVLAMFGTAWLHAYAHGGAYRSDLLQIHRSLGVTIWMATMFRLAWRLTRAKLPAFPAHMTKIHRKFVQIGEYMLYALLLVQPATGFTATLWRGRQFGLFLWHVPSLVAEDRAVWITLETVHECGACAFGLLIAGHAAVALFHHFVLRDDVLHCMAPVIDAERRKPEFFAGWQSFSAREP